MDVMLNWGGFLFEVPQTAYHDLTLTTAWRWSEHDRQGQAPVYHYGGTGATQLTLACTLYTELGGIPASVESLHTLANAGTPHLLSDGTGKVWGNYCLTGIDDHYGEAMHTKGVPAKRELTLTFVKQGD